MLKIFNASTAKAMVNCFVCDQRLTGENVNLASSVSSHSKVSLPEKISQLIGDDYVVAVTEQDSVCKRCASLLNHMDKLENELTLVKRALTTNISQKYKIAVGDGQAPIQPTLANGMKTDSASDYEDEKKLNTSVGAAAALAKKKPPPVNKVIPNPKPTKPAENVTKLKIYKCGFCSYQSKELSNVRLHMKIHIRANKNEGGEGDKTTTTTTASPMLTPSKQGQVSVRRRVFRCQVCSASFDDRNKCLEHISRDHTAAGRKLVEQKQSQEEQKHSEAETSAAHTSEQTMDKGQQQDETAHHEEMDTSEPPPIYSCDTCPSAFDNDVDFANHNNEHVKCDTSKAELPNIDSEVTQTATQDNQAVNEDETPKDPNIGLDIEAMIAALHSEGPESGGDSMPSI